MRHIKPILSFDGQGQVVPIERGRGREPEDCFVALATGVLGTHVGPGAWGIFYQVEDGVRKE